MVNTKNDEIRVACYELNWLEIRQKKIVLLWLQQIQHEPNLHVAGYYKLNLNFAALVRVGILKLISI